MRTFILMLAVAMVAIYNIAGVVGVFAWMLGLTAWGIGCGMFWYGKLNSDDDADGVVDAGDACDYDDAQGDACDDDNDGPLLLALFVVLDPCTTENVAVLYSVCSSPYGACSLSPAEPEEVEAQPKFLPIRRGRMAHMGEAERRASRSKADNSWKRHRSTQWR